MVIRNLARVLLSLMLAQPVVAQEVASVKVTDNIYMITAKGGNIGVLIGQDGTFMIDDKYAPMTDDVLAEVKALGGSNPRFVINTHFHEDHTGGNENVGKVGSVIVSHENVRKRLAEGTVIRAFKMSTPPKPDIALPIVTFTQEISFHLNGETVDISHLPTAHTDGDSFVHFKDSNVIHTGDIFFNGFFPFIDTGHGGTVKGMIAGVDAILTLADDKTRIIPGHGPLSNNEELLAYRALLETAQQRLGKLKAQGMSAAEAVAEKPLADLHEKWGGVMFDSNRWIEIIYDGI